MPNTLTKRGGPRYAAAAARRPALADEGIVVGIVAVTGTVDSVEDIIIPGAFAKTLRERRPKLCWMHDWKIPLGRVLHIVELRPGDKRLPAVLPDGKAWPKEAGALVATMQFNLRTQAGRDFFEHAKEWAKSGEAAFSIGYKVTPGMASKRGDGVRLIYALELFEVSLVLHGAHPMALALEVKSAAPILGLEHKDTGRMLTVALEAKSAVAEARALEAKSARSALLEAKSIPLVTEGKSMPRIRGSYEERRSLLTDALETLLTPTNDKGEREGWLCIDATFPDTVICTVTTPASDLGTSYKVPYSMTSEGVQLGKASEVELSVVVSDGADEPKPAETGEAVRMRFIDPATAMIGDATRFIAAMPEGKSLESLETPVLTLLDALAMKGYDVAATMGNDLYNDDDDMPSENDHYSGQRKGMDEDEDLDGEPDDTEPDADEDDGYESYGDDLADDEGYDEEQDPSEDEPDGDEDDDLDESEQIKLNPDDVWQQIKDLLH